MTRGAFPVLTRDLSSWQVTSRTQWSLLSDVPVAAGPGGQGGRIGVAVAGDEVDDLDGLLAVPGDRAAQLRDLGRAVEPDAFSSSRTAGISLDFSGTATWPGTVPMPRARAATRCGAFPSLFLAPRTVVPSMAVTSRPPARTALVCSQAPRTRSGTPALTRAKARRKADSPAGPRAAPSTAST